ncbi:hypothetical protein A4G20_07375 [Pasteurellaceae bacterium RH1A]|nr:hypothetical protein A4G20_07375 [Pasteurellaceae bacterium RH1A]
MYKRLFLAIFLQIFALLSPLAWAGKLAIVIDDIGYRAKEDAAIYALPKEVSVAIIPVAPSATARAKEAYAQGRDVIIHLPMQPLKDQPIEAGALKVGMSQEQVSNLIQAAQKLVPHAIGLNNHMGSRATADQALMNHLMASLKAENLAFLDSKTNGKSVAYQTAKNLGLKALERHIFLDDIDTLVNTQAQFQAAVNYARKHGTAIMIGHPRKHSISALQAGIKNLPKEVELVSLSQLWDAQSPSQVEPKKPFIMRFDLAPAPTSQAPFDNATPLLRGVPRE